MNIIFYTMESFLYSLNLLIITTKIYKVTADKKRYLIFSFLLHTILLAVGFFIDLYLFIILAFINHVTHILLLKAISINFKIISIIETYLSIYSLNIILTVSVNMIFSFSDSILLFVDFAVCILISLCFAILAINTNLSAKIKTLLKVLPQSNKYLILLSCIVNGIFLALLSSNPAFNDNSTWSIVIRIFSVLSSILLFTILPIFIAMSISNLYLKEQNTSIQKEIEAQAKYYSEKAKSDFELRRFKHDFNNLRIGVKTALEMNNIEAATKLLYNDEYDTDGNLFDSGNGIADAILYEKQDICKTHNTYIKFNGSFPSDRLSPIDLCILLGNSLDNAIEACEKIPNNQEKIISVESKYICGLLFLTITNPTLDDVVIKENTVQTTKENIHSHGFGLYSLNKVVKKYNGEFSLTCENRIFSVKIELCI